MKILLAGDLHFNMPQFQWLAEQKHNYDCLCLAGDLLDGNSGEFSQQSQWVSHWLKELDTHVFVCSGNHDLDEDQECNWLTSLKSRAICVDNQIKLFHGLKFGCIPYLGAELQNFHDCDVLLTHVPPLKTKTALSMIDGKLKDWGDRELYRAVKGSVITPRYILCGHVENPSAKRDCIFGVQIINPGAEHSSSLPSHEVLIFEA